MFINQQHKIFVNYVCYHININIIIKTKCLRLAKVLHKSFKQFIYHLYVHLHYFCTNEPAFSNFTG